MAWSATENFEGYAAGDNLSGKSGGSGWSGAQASWSATNGSIVAVPSGGEGSLCAKISMSGSTGGMYRTCDNVSAGILSFKVRLSKNNPADQVIFAFNSKIYVQFHSSGNIQSYNNDTGSYQNIQTYAANTWYTVDIEWDTVNQANKYRIRINGGSWTSWRTVLGGSGFTGVSMFYASFDTNTMDIWVDDIKNGAAGTAYTLTASQSSLTLTGIATAFRKALRFLAASASNVISVVDSYAESNYSSQLMNLGYSGAQIAVGQSFTGDGNAITHVKLYLGKDGSPTGNATVKIYAHSGTFGTSSVPTGSALATSDNLDVATLAGSLGSPQLVTIPFSGINRITLTAGTRYCLALEYTGGNSSNYPFIGQDSTSPTHAGNAFYKDFGSSSWAALSGRDTIFYVYTTAFGGFTLTGVSNVLSWGRKLAATTASYALTGSTAIINYGKILVAAVGSLALTGQAATLGWGRRLVAATGPFLTTAADALLNVAKSLAASVANFALTGHDAAMRRARQFLADVASFTLTGQDALFYKALKLAATYGTFALTGMDAIIGLSIRLAASAGSYVLSGQNTLFTWTKNLILSAASGTYALVGLSARLLINGSTQFYRNLFTKQNSSYSDKLSSKGNTYSDKLSSQSTSYTNKYQL